MSIATSAASREAGPPPPAPPLPATPGEIITALAHFHRAEMGRMTSWRNRIDLTTNWAITVVAGMLSVSLSTPSAHHGVLLFAMLLVQLLLAIEARRYRFFDVYRSRVRRLERNYFAQTLAPVPGADPAWAMVLAEDLRRPTFLISLRTAMSRRLRRNYIWMFLVLLLAWVLKVTSPRLNQAGAGPEAMQPWIDVLRSLSLGPIPGWVVLLAVAAFHAWLLLATFGGRAPTGELSYGDVHM